MLELRSWHMYVQVEMMFFLDRESNIKIFHIYPNQIVNIKSGRGVHLKKSFISMKREKLIQKTRSDISKESKNLDFNDNIPMRVWTK